MDSYEVSPGMVVQLDAAKAKEIGAKKVDLADVAAAWEARMGYTREPAAEPAKPAPSK